MLIITNPSIVNLYINHALINSKSILYYINPQQHLYRYELTSIISTARKLLGIPNDPLTDRDAWSATFENVLLQLEVRTAYVAYVD